MAPALLALWLTACENGGETSLSLDPPPEISVPPPEAPAPTPEPPSIIPGQTIRLMSYNIHHANPPLRPDVIDVEAIAAVINAEQPDFVALQEVDVHTGRSGTDVDQAQALAQMTGMEAFFSKSLDYDGGQYGNAVLSRFPIAGSQAYALPVGDEGGEIRSVARIMVTTEAGPLHFASTHLENERAGTRDLQAAVLLDIDAALEAPLVLAGDFNAEHGSSTIALIEQRFVVACPGRCPPTSSALFARRAIDFVFLNTRASSVLTVLSYRTVKERRASDHLPVLVELRYH